ncbi:MAG: hypothetical protein JO083_06620 [Candidatus Eremiobacteraeota bacterium]|nr:hypothetical protein [Candidatus Eremiobacteraeota bacterium]
MMLLVGAIEACALYQAARAVISFRSARTRDDLDGANLRALSALAFAALGAGEGLRYVGIALFALLGLAYAVTRLRRAGPAPEPEIAAGI